MAAGRLDGAFARSGAHEWDLAAADIILAEAGGAITTEQGVPVTYNRPLTGLPPLIIAGPNRHEALSALASEGRLLQ